MPVPTVSIGVPVYNGESTLRAMMTALLAQTYTDFEIVVSDNASTDQTAAICAEYANGDRRIRYVRQSENIGPEQNFKFVLDEARGRYFMWSACDDIRSPDFLEENVKFLESNDNYVASTSPTILSGFSETPVQFALDGELYFRLRDFLDNGWRSHGIFYAVFRTDVLRRCDVLGRTFFAFDWAINLFMASQGKIHRSLNGKMVSGMSGISKRRSVWKRYRTHAIGWIVPFHTFSAYALKLSQPLPIAERAAIAVKLLKLNVRAAQAQVKATASSLFAGHPR